MTNPLLTIKPLPEFSSLVIDDIEDALEQKLEQNRQAIAQLLNESDPADWDNFGYPFEQMADELESLWAPISQLNAVKNSDALRESYNLCLAKLTAYGTELGQHAGLYRRFNLLADGPTYQQLNQAQQKCIDNALRDFHLSGVDLPSDKQARFKEIKSRLAELASRFAENILDATQAWQKHITDQHQLKGLPQTAMNCAHDAASKKGLDGWRLTLDIPSYLPVMQYCDNQALREEMYYAYTTRASDQGPNAGQWDNGPLMEEIITLRHDLAKLLDFDNYACRSLVSKMAQSPGQVMNFLQDLAGQSRPVAEQEIAELEEFSRQLGRQQPLQAWDIPYYSEKLREHKYALSQEALRPYFPVSKVIKGMFAIVGKVIGIECVQQPDFDSYHADVHLYNVMLKGEIIAQFYLDLFARDNKRGGAWMADCRNRRVNPDGGIQLPVAFLTCNFTAPTAQQPSLLTHQEVTTLFHEFGHGLHHMLTKVDVPSVAGINGVEWDAVELPSQFLENWCWEKQAIPLISAHYQTGEKLPDEMLDKLLAAKNFQSGLQMMRQLEFSIFDFQLHSDYASPSQKEIQAVLDQVRQEISVVPTPTFNRFQHGFSHIFAGGYAAGYYSYKWAEVLAADAFSLFEENGIFHLQSGKRFCQEILQKGGSDKAMNLYTRFRGREPRADALLRRAGIVKA